MAKVGPNAVNLAIAEMIGQLLTFTTHPIDQKLKSEDALFLLSVGVSIYSPACLSN